jgi:hypothetical protein
MRKQWKQVEQGLQRFAFVWKESPAALYEVRRKNAYAFHLNVKDLKGSF